MNVHEKKTMNVVKEIYNDYVGGLLIDQMDNGKTEQNTMTAQDIAFFVWCEAKQIAPKETRFAGDRFLAFCITAQVMDEKEYNFGEFVPSEIYRSLVKK